MRQLMQEDVEQFNRMIGYVRAEQDAVLAAVIHPDKRGCPKVKITFLLIPVVQPVREILGAKLLENFLLILSHETGKDDVIPGEASVHPVVKNLYGMGKIGVIVQIVRRLHRKVFISGSRSYVQCAGGHIRFPPSGRFSMRQG